MLLVHNWNKILRQVVVSDPLQRRAVLDFGGSIPVSSLNSTGLREMVRHVELLLGTKDLL